MPFASHRIVGVMELDLSCTLDEPNSSRTNRSLAAHPTAAAVRRIECELADSKSKPRVPCEPTVKVDSAALQRELDAELANLFSDCRDGVFDVA